jgi:protein FAM50
MIPIVYSYWDGSGHRREMDIARGCSIGDFLAEAHQVLVKSFSDLRRVSSDQLMFIKEDLILPHDLTFYELIRDRVWGKTGPLFNFQENEAVGLSDVRQERQDSHVGKIVDRSWYEKNKHVYPWSTWEIFDPNKQYKRKMLAEDGTIRRGGGR